VPIEHRGCTFEFSVRGEGPPVLMIQGVGLHGDGWGPQVDGLASDFRCLTFDNRGMGRSQPIGAAITVDQMAEDALAMMDAQGWESAHIVGHSLGGLVAQHIALTARQRVRSISLLCTFSKGSDATKLSPWMLWIGLRSRIGPRRLRRLAFLRIVMPPDVLAQTDRDDMARRLEPIFGHDLADQPSVVMKQLSAMRAYDATPRLKELTQLPALIVSARHDRIAPPAIGRLIAEHLPGAAYTEILEASHGVTVQCAGKINELLKQHISGAELRWHERKV
jgi:pimeloyl-ACP methyl ester carboxylesterase